MLSDEAGERAHAGAAEEFIRDAWCGISETAANASRPPGSFFSNQRTLALVVYRGVVRGLRGRLVRGGWGLRIFHTSGDR